MGNGIAATTEVKTPSQVGLEEGTNVVRQAVARDPITTLAILVGAVMMAGSIWWMRSEVHDSRVAMINAVQAHEDHGHADAVTKTEFRAAISELRAAIAANVSKIDAQIVALGAKVDLQGAATTARVDRLIERMK